MTFKPGDKVLAAAEVVSIDADGPGTLHLRHRTASYDTYAAVLLVDVLPADALDTAIRERDAALTSCAEAGVALGNAWAARDAAEARAVAATADAAALTQHLDHIRVRAGTFDGEDSDAVDVLDAIERLAKVALGMGDGLTGTPPSKRPNPGAALLAAHAEMRARLTKERDEARTLVDRMTAALGGDGRSTPHDLARRVRSALNTARTEAATLRAALEMLLTQYDDHIRADDREQARAALATVPR